MAKQLRHPPAERTSRVQVPVRAVTSLHVITGAAGAGKTTVIDILASRGHTVFPEFCEEYFKSAEKLGIDSHTDPVAFALFLTKKQQESELEAPEGSFFDRGVIDNEAFMRLRGGESVEHVSLIKKSKYDKVFFLELPPENKYEIKDRSYKAAQLLDEELRKVYLELGCEVIDVPFDEYEKQADFIEIST